MNLFESSQVHGDMFQLARTHPAHRSGKNDPVSEQTATMGFRNALVQSLEDVNSYQKQHEQLSVQAVTNPDSVDPHDVTIASSRAQLSLSITKNVLDRVIQAYRDITNLR